MVNPESSVFQLMECHSLEFGLYFCSREGSNDACSERKYCADFNIQYGTNLNYDYTLSGVSDIVVGMMASRY